ncbi:F-box/LRR-repeat protein, partial [Trifolium pratense]
FNELVDSHCLTETSLNAFRDCALQDVYLGEYLGVDDGWMDVIASQGSSLLAVDVSGSNVTDNGLRLLKDCLNLQALTLNYCDQFSEHGLKHISGR